MRQMIADYMETGFLDNISEMFRHDPTLFSHVPYLMSDLRGRVRLGTVALAEGLIPEFRKELRAQIPELASVLAEDHPTVRADAVYLMGLIGGSEALSHLERRREDPDPQVRALIAETIEELKACGRHPVQP